jgi:hypothetical protein
MLKTQIRVTCPQCVNLQFQFCVALETYLSFEYFLYGCADILGVNVGLHFQLQNSCVLFYEEFSRKVINL